MRYLLQAAPIDFDAIAENTRNVIRIVSEDTEALNMNELQRASDEHLAVAVVAEALTASVNGTNKTFALAQFPVVRPRMLYDLKGVQIGSTLNPIVVTLNSVVRNEYDGTGTQSAGTYYTLDYNLGELRFVTQLGASVTPTNAWPLTVSYYYTQNVSKFDTDLGSLVVKDKYDLLLTAIGTMAGTMALDDLVADLKRSLHDSAAVFDAADDADFVRFLNQALPDMGWKRSRTMVGQVPLVAGTPSYSLAEYTDFYSYKTHLWEPVAGRLQAWEPGYPGAMPRIHSYRDGSGHWLGFEPAPSAEHIALRGAVCKFYYMANHALGTNALDTTVAALDRGLLLLRAQAEAMLELTLRNVAKPVHLRDGLSGTPRNSTPRALYDALLSTFAEAR
ncbi:MAG: hypothetical protein IPN53_05255 [Comamonadaceae bacterium]|nr:hypothetical protein [Comamonadaceae bacterium]